MSTIRSDAILHFHEGIWGTLGYAVPHHGNEPGTLNPRLYRLTSLLGRQLFDMMHRRDIDLTVPPRIGFLKDVHDLCVRAHQLLQAWTVPHNVEEFEPVHVSPAGNVYRVWPVPHYHVRNDLIREWSTLLLMLQSELMQHTENAKDMDIGPRVKKVVNAYLGRVYREMQAECFGKSEEGLNAWLTQEDFDAYDPDQWFTGVERTDTVPNLGQVVTEDMLAPLRAGILVTNLPADLQPFAGTLHGHYEHFRAQTTQQLEEANAIVDSARPTFEDLAATRQVMTPSGAGQTQSQSRNVGTPSGSPFGPTV